MFLAALLSFAYAAEDGLADDDFSFLDEGDVAAEARAADAVSGDSFSLYGDEEEEDFADFTLKVDEPAPVAPVAKPQPAGKTPLSGNFDARVVSVERESVVVELPVLLGGTDDVSGEYWLIGEVFVDGNKVGETRQLVTSAAVTSQGTIAYLKVQAPVQNTAGSVEVRVSKAAGSKKTALFSRSTSYSL
jgi:hypothetical protein